MNDSKQQQDVFPLDKVKAAIWACFAQDAYGLSYHWVYDQAAIPADLPDKLQNPAAQWHKAKVAGDFTFFGDQLLVLLHSLAEKHSWDRADFAARFATVFKADTYKGHISSAIRSSMKQLAEKTPLALVGQGGEQDTSALGMSAPIALVAKSADDFVAQAREHSSFTHNAPMVILGTDYCNKVFLSVLAGKSPVAACQQLVKERPFRDNQAFCEMVEKGLGSKDKETKLAIRVFGQACTIGGGLPGVLHLIAKYENDLPAAIKANIAAGGDSNGRGLPMAMILGAHVGLKGLPSYVKDMKAYDQITKLIDQASARAK